MEVIQNVFLAWMLPVIVSFFLTRVAFWIARENLQSKKTLVIVRFVWGGIFVALALASLYHIKEYSFLKYHFFIYCILGVAGIFAYDRKYGENKR